jgi:hypothetical protein
MRPSTRAGRAARQGFPRHRELVAGQPRDVVHRFRTTESEAGEIIGALNEGETLSDVLRNLALTWARLRPVKEAEVQYHNPSDPL